MSNSRQTAMVNRAIAQHARRSGGGGKLARFLGEGEAVGIELDGDAFAGAQLAAGDQVRERLHEVSLDGALEVAGADGVGRSISADKVLVAVGRRAHTTGFGTYSTSGIIIGCDPNKPPSAISIIVRAAGPLNLGSS